MPQEQYCADCETTKPLADFHKNQWRCKPCQKAYHKSHYEANKQIYLDKAKTWRNRMHELVINEKQKPCMDCGVQYPHYVMDFDHIQGKKLGNISAMSRKKGIIRLQEELSKCELVCANCHRQRTWKRSH
jgi:hypothetical protein